MSKLLLPKCDKCGSKWFARYRRDKPPPFYCRKCSRRHPRWSAEELAQAKKEGKRLYILLNPQENSNATTST